MNTNVKPTRRTPAAQAGAANFNSIKDIRARRITEEVSATLLARTAAVERTRLSFAEREHIELTEDELKRLSEALDKLIAAKRKVQEFASAVGWPVGANLST